MADDLISRQAAIDAVNDVIADYIPYLYGRYEALPFEMASAIIRLPSAQRTGRWIPVSERLPDDGSEVWVTIKGSDVIKVEAGETIEQAIDRVNRIRWVTRAYWSEEEHGWNDPTFGCPLVVQPITWMPIEKPEPYEEGQE